MAGVGAEAEIQQPSRCAKISAKNSVDGECQRTLALGLTSGVACLLCRLLW